MQNSLAHSDAEISSMEVYAAVEGSDTDVSNDEGADVEVTNGNADANTNNSCSINIESNDNTNDDENLSYDTVNDDTNGADTYDNDANNNENDNSIHDFHTAHSEVTLVTSNVDKNRALDKIKVNDDNSDNNVTGTEESITGVNFQNDNQNNEFWTTRMKWTMIILVPIVMAVLFYLFYYLAPNNDFPNNDFSRKIDPFPTSSPVYESSSPLSQYPTGSENIKKNSPSHNPISSPTHSPSLSKDLKPSHNPSSSPTHSPSLSKVLKLSHSPSSSPTNLPSLSKVLKLSHSPSSSPTNLPSLSKDFSPSSPPSKYCATTDAVIKIIKSISVTVNTKAKEWIFSEHNQKLDACKDLISITQRYILSLLYYSTTGDDWNINTNWLTNVSECDWKFIACDEDKIVKNITLGKYM